MKKGEIQATAQESEEYKKLKAKRDKMLAEFKRLEKINAPLKEQSKLLWIASGLGSRMIAILQGDTEEPEHCKLVDEVLKNYY